MGKGSTVGILILIGLGLFILSRKSNFQTFSNPEIQTSIEPETPTRRISGTSRGLTSTINSNIDNFARRLINAGIGAPRKRLVPLGTGKFIEVED